MSDCQTLTNKNSMTQMSFIYHMIRKRMCVWNFIRTHDLCLWWKSRSYMLMVNCLARRMSYNNRWRQDSDKKCGFGAKNLFIFILFESISVSITFHIVHLISFPHFLRNSLKLQWHPIEKR